MSSLNQLVSEIAHSIGQVDNIPARRGIRRGIIHARNELIRKSYANHNYTDKVLMQCYKVTLVDVPEVDIFGITDLGGGSIGIRSIKRSVGKVPKPVRLTNNLPFHSIRTAGVTSPINIPFIRQSISKYYKYLPGMNCFPTYDFINGYLYIVGLNDSIHSIFVESVFEYPHYIDESTSTDAEKYQYSDDDEFLIPEDMIGDIKKLVLETFNPKVERETNEVNNENLTY